MRPPLDDILAPAFPPRLPWVNAPARDARTGAAATLVEFWDFCRANSLRTLPYVKAWHERYADAGLRIVGVHCPGFEPSRAAGAVRDAVARLGIRHAVLIDSEFELWGEYENEGWPARYLFDADARLVEYHLGEGAYGESELAIQRLLGVEREPLAPLRAEDAPGARLAPQTPDQPGAYCGPYGAGAVWAVLEGAGVLRFCATGASGELSVEHPGVYELVDHRRHTAGELQLQLRGGVRCHAVCFTPGVA